MDENEILNYKLGEYKKGLKERFDKTYSRYDGYSGSWINKYRIEIKERQLSFDSISNSIELYNAVVDSTIQWMTSQEKGNYIQRKDVLPPDEVLVFHSLIAHPEFYIK